jgi:hypothetical protein
MKMIEGHMASKDTPYLDMRREVFSIKRKKEG